MNTKVLTREEMIYKDNNRTDRYIKILIFLTENLHVRILVFRETYINELTQMLLKEGAKLHNTAIQEVFYKHPVGMQHIKSICKALYSPGTYRWCSHSGLPCCMVSLEELIKC